MHFFKGNLELPREHTHTHIHTYIHTHTHTYIHTYTKPDETLHTKPVAVMLVTLSSLQLTNKIKRLTITNSSYTLKTVLFIFWYNVSCQKSELNMLISRFKCT